MEVAPNVVDASAVALPSSPHVITDVEFDCDASVPVFDPLESDEEDELDALSRKVTGVPAVGRAALQGSTQVDNHDEPMVSGRFTPWLHEEPVVRPNIGRHVVARTDLAESTSCRDGATNPGVMEVIAETVHTTVEASPTVMVRCMDTVQDNAEHDSEGIQTHVTVPASSAALRPAGVEERVPSPGQRVASNRFFCLATDSEDEQIDQRTLLGEDTCSDTVSLVGQRNSGRRLRLRWSEHTPPVNATGNVQVPDVPDSHERRLMRVRAAMRRDSRPLEVRRAAEVVRSLAERVGQADLEAGVPSPTVVSCQHSSHVGSCNVGSIVPSVAVVAQSAQHLSIPVCGVEMPGHDAVMAGWEALHHALNVMGIQSVEGLSEWVSGLGCPTTTMGCPFLRACARTTHEQRRPHQRQGHCS